MSESRKSTALINDNRTILQACASFAAPELLVAKERRLLADVEPLNLKKTDAIRKAISGGHDVLGDAYSQVNSPDVRRPLGQTYTPRSIVDSMVDTAGKMRKPDRVIDVGCGSGRFAIACARAFAEAKVVAGVKP